MRNLVTNLIVIISLIGTAVGPHPLPTAVCDFEPIIGREIRVQLLEKAEKRAVAVVACAASGFNAMGTFRPIHTRLPVAFYGVEAADVDAEIYEKYSATLTKGLPGVFSRSRVSLKKYQDHTWVVTRSRPLWNSLALALTTRS
ncbi:pyridoxal-phosphate dependent enzyme [Fragilaria crotonensis]|nr:pyridoxal-phosphate dependent enzyme [Fragilaria crotonensis]